MYRVPGTNENEFIRTYYNIMKTLKQEKKNIVIGMDQNLDLLKIHTHQNTCSFLETNFTHGMIPTVTRPTGITNSTATLIDNIYISSKDSNRISSKVIVSDITNHFPILVFLPKEKNREQLPLKFKHRNLANNAHEFLKRMLKTRDWSHLKIMSVEDSILDINTTIQESIVAPKKEVCMPTKFVTREERMTKGLLKSCINKLYKKCLGKNKNDPLYTTYIAYRNLYNKLRRIATQTYYCEPFPNLNRIFPKHGRR